MAHDVTLSAMQLHRIKHFAALLFIVLFATGCSTIGYYSQAVGGHLKLMQARQSIDKILADESADPELRQKLQTLVDARQYAVDRLSLPENDSYDTYVETGRRYVTWNVVAAEEFSLSAKTWCFPVAGCVNYKGYFAEEDARAYAKQLSDQNLDVNVGGALAYSTLGYFDDPVLDTMLNGGDIRYVGTLFHELAHQLLYVKDDSNFNEAFASFVEQEGLRIWLTDRDEVDRIELFDNFLARGDDFSDLLKTTREGLLAAYNADVSDEIKRERKKSVLEDMLANYEKLKEERWGGYTGYDGWFSREVNNARLVSVATYQKLIPAFEVIYRDAGSDLPAFYQKAKEIAALPRKQRLAEMDEYLRRSAEPDSTESVSN